MPGSPSVTVLRSPAELDAESTPSTQCRIGSGRCSAGVGKELGTRGKRAPSLRHSWAHSVRRVRRVTHGKRLSGLRSLSRQLSADNRATVQWLTPLPPMAELLGLPTILPSSTVTKSGPCQALRTNSDLGCIAPLPSILQSMS